jgi:hypothetical protein
MKVVATAVGPVRASRGLVANSFLAMEIGDGDPGEMLQMSANQRSDSRWDRPARNEGFSTRVSTIVPDSPNAYAGGVGASARDRR